MRDFENLDFYQLLGLDRSASPEEVKRAYRREISKYHPDRFVNASPQEQAYAQLRSQRLTEAYATLSDFTARNAYNRGQQPAPRTVPRPQREARTTPAEPAQPRDYQAELYEQAKAHLADGRTLQAIGVLRQLQQINPFYRDSAELLAQAEAQAQPRERRRGPSPLLIGGGIAGGALVALVVWGLAQRGSPTNTAAALGTQASVVSVAATAMPAATALPTSGATEAPTIAPTVAPTVVPPTDAPTSAPPTETPVPPSETPAPPTATSAPTPAPTAEGTLVLSDGFDGEGWADLAGPSWRVGYSGDRYRVLVNQGAGVIWSFRAGAPSNFNIAVDTQVKRGEGGLLLRFVDARNYLSFIISPQQTSYRLELHTGGAINVLAGGQTDALTQGGDAVNRLTARLKSGKMELLVNSKQIALVDVPNLPSSNRYGLLGIGGATASEVYFDNLEVRSLP